MTKLKTVGVRELKNHLSSYLREVESGVRIYISDRRRIIAELGKLHDPSAIASKMHPIMSEWISAGVVHLSLGQKKKLPLSPVKLPAGTALSLLDQDRSE